MSRKYDNKTKEINTGTYRQIMIIHFNFLQQAVIDYNADFEMEDMHHIHINISIYNISTNDTYKYIDLFVSLYRKLARLDIERK